MIIFHFEGSLVSNMDLDRLDIGNDIEWGKQRALPKVAIMGESRGLYLLLGYLTSSYSA